MACDQVGLDMVLLPMACPTCQNALCSKCEVTNIEPNVMGSWLQLLIFYDSLIYQFS